MAENDGITFDFRDEYQRKPIAEKIIQLLESASEISPMVIDGSWGTGKTEFCKKLIHLIDTGESSIKPIYVDAFKADHADEPLMTLLAAILQLLPETDRPSFIQKALPAVRFGIKTTLKAGVSWLLKQDAAEVADDFDADLKKAGDQAINHAVESLLTDHVAAEQSIATLKDALSELVKDKPIVMFIDELDRCRPDFAVSMMENIKHIFDVDGVQFVLVTNSDQLRASINNCYGAAIDAHRYLDKFIKFSFKLPQTFKPDNYTPVLASVHHLNDLIKNSEILNESYLIKGSLDGFFETLVKVNQLSLREVETFVRYLEIYQTLTGNGGLKKNTIFGYILFRVLAVFLFCFKPDISEKVAISMMDVPSVASVLGKSQLFDLSSDSYPDHSDTIVAMLSIETGCDIEAFKPTSKELEKKWRGGSVGIFESPATVGKPVKIIQEVIEKLKLIG